MKVIVAKNAGFCFGVRRAVELARNEVQKRGKVFTWGKLIHNEAVIRDLSAEGILPVASLDELRPGDTLIIRAHGAPPSLFDECTARGIRTVDATCPFVHRIHPIVAQAAEAGIASAKSARRSVRFMARSISQGPAGRQGILRLPHTGRRAGRSAVARNPAAT